MNEKPLVKISNDENGDWMTMYIDGIKVYDNHSIDGNRVLEILAFDNLIDYEYEVIK